MKYPITAVTFPELRRMSSPGSGDVPEAIPFLLYDTQTYTDNATTELTFFAATTSDRSLSNLDSGGSLPDPSFFRIFGITLDVFAADGAFMTTGAGGFTGAIDDIGQLVVSGRGRFNLTISNKSYGPLPLSLLHATGGPTGDVAGTWTAEEQVQWAVNGHPDGGFYCGGAIVIPPKVGFNVVCQWPAAVDLTADYRLRLGLLGTLHRRVL